MLENPSPDDWLMFSRTYDAQRFSPLKQINKQNVAQLRMAWDAGMGAGQTETIPIVHNGVMYVVNPGRDRAGAGCDERATCCGSTSARLPANVAARDARSRSRFTRTSSLTRRPTVSWSGWTRAPASCAGRPRSIRAATPPAR